MSVCCGGILGLGEGVEDRLKMLETLSGFNPPPESVPINTLMPIKGTPMEDNEPVDVFSLVRMIACTRMAIPKAKVRLSAGRYSLSKEAQALCYFAGANSIFYGDKLLTTVNPRANEDMKLLQELGLAPQSPNPGMDAPGADTGRPLMPCIRSENEHEESPNGCDLRHAPASVST